MFCSDPSHRYIPSDFFKAEHVFGNAFPIHVPLKLTKPTSFHIFDKEKAPSPIANDSVFDPQDADFSYSAKVMLLALPHPNDLYAKTCHLAGKGGQFRSSSTLVLLP